MRRRLVVQRNWTVSSAWTASSAWLKHSVNRAWTSTPSFVTKMQYHLYSMEEQCLTTGGDVFQTRDKALCSNFDTPFNFGFAFATLFAPPKTQFAPTFKTLLECACCIPIEY